MKAAVLTADQTIEIRQTPDPAPGPGQVLVRVSWASICGTDLHIYLGEFKERVKYPRILGHEFSGRVEALGSGVDGLSPGDEVVADPILWCGRCPACLTGHNNVCQHLKLVGIEYDGAFAELTVVDADKVFRIPEGVSLRDACLTELYALGVHSLRRAVVEPGDRLVVLGAGRLGLSVLQVARNSGAAWLAAVDVLEPRLAKAKAFGADLIVNAAQEDPAQAVLEATAGAGADRVIECIGTARAIPSGEHPPQQAVRMTRNGGRVVLMGLGGQQSPLLWKEVALKELGIMGSRVTLGDFPRALDLMARGVFEPEGLVSGEFALEQTGEAFRLLEEDPERYIKLLIRVES